ncbi:hypothetical protein LTR70_007635 [Exophiala xenobiotica]|uniref:Protein kinase domain-containing protein n=1 Tax=Lithohypha guttulata TaxID=1690604 RepID=A0ABR0K3Y8_9EURO|nr:hypothetical protein LTR24_007167 [Lithohypha guttulata]KAK5313449.1 hypothetical protein LTR70_007635 [Exophiala xenobiotica]
MNVLKPLDQEAVLIRPPQTDQSTNYSLSNHSLSNPQSQHPILHSPTPLAAMPHQAIFFDEGPGFIFVKPLGEGVYGSASLVSCVKDGKYYIRKEDLRTDERLDCRKPNQEVRNALLAGHIEGTAKVQGWANHQNARNGKKFTVTYWDYYTGGTLAELIARSRKARTTIPELWIAFWASEMLGIILDIHKAGVSHRDGHLNNWFLTSRDSNDLPLIGLGDFGLSRRQGTCRDWLDTCRQDFEFIYHNIDSLLEGRRDQTGLHDLVQNLRFYVRRSQDVRSLQQHMSMLKDSATAMLRKGCRRPVNRQQNLFKEGIPFGRGTISLGFWPYKDPYDPRIKTLKSYMVAEVLDRATFKLKGRPREVSGGYSVVGTGNWTQKGTCRTKVIR